MWIWSYNLIDSVISIISQGIEMTENETGWQRTSYKAYLRILEAIAIDRQNFFLLDLYLNRRWRSDWHNLHVCSSKFAENLSVMLQDIPLVVNTLQVDELTRQNDVQDLLFKKGTCLNIFLMQYSKWVWEDLKNDKSIINTNEKAARIFRDCSSKLGEFNPLEIHISSSGEISGLQIFEIDFDEKVKLSQYIDQLKSKHGITIEKCNVLGKHLFNKCKVEEIF